MKKMIISYFTLYVFNGNGKCYTDGGIVRGDRNDGVIIDCNIYLGVVYYKEIVK